MNTTDFGELVFTNTDIVNLVMQGTPVDELEHLTVDPAVDIAQLQQLFPDLPNITNWQYPSSAQNVQEFDQKNQQHWFLPAEYQQIDVAEYVLKLCKTDAELQRVGQELLLYQERDMFDILRYMIYLVDFMRENNIVWGVGRGSSVASYVLYLIGVHQIDSIYYDLDVEEFLR